MIEFHVRATVSREGPVPSPIIAASAAVFWSFPHGGPAALLSAATLVSKPLRAVASAFSASSHKVFSCTATIESPHALAALASASGNSTPSALCMRKCTARICSAPPIGHRLRSQHGGRDDFVLQLARTLNRRLNFSHGSSVRCLNAAVHDGSRLLWLESLGRMVGLRSPRRRLRFNEVDTSAVNHAVTATLRTQDDESGPTGVSFQPKSDSHGSRACLANSAALRGPLIRVGPPRPEPPLSPTPCPSQQADGQVCYEFE